MRCFPSRLLTPSRFSGSFQSSSPCLPCRTPADYRVGVTKLGPFADYLVINISSPNTPGTCRQPGTMLLILLLIPACV